MLGKRSRTLQRTTSTCDIGMASPGVCPSEKPRPSVQVIGFNPKAPFDAVGSSSASPRWDPQCLLTNVHGETASKGSTQVQPVSGGLSSLFRSNVSSVDESNAAARAKTMITKVILVQSKDLGTGKKSQCGPVDLSACKSAANARLPAVDFLDECYLCKQRLVPERDIYMYRGDRAFCSVDCRWQQILLDERTEKCGSAVLNPPPTSPSRRSGHRSGVDGTGTATAA